MSKKQTNSQMLTALQFPLKLSFACTAHKMQGATVSKPDPLILDLRHIMEPAQGYVMLSRVQALNQLFIVNEVPKAKIIPSPSAVQELSRLKAVSNNDIEKTIRAFTFLTSVNIRSLPKHIDDLRHDYKMNQCEMICIQETWCLDNFENNHLIIDGFNLHLTNRGRGKGVANYFKDNFRLTGEVNSDLFQMTKFSSSERHVINIYRSQGANSALFIENLNKLLDGCNECFIVGDFNVDFLVNDHHPIFTNIISHGFKQLVRHFTHESGSTLDYAFVKSKKKYDYDIHWPYYTDHAAICVVKLVKLPFH